jgi:hypothetical protein
VGREVVTAVSSGAEQVTPGPGGQVPTEELVRRRGAKPIDDPHSMAYGAFASDEELDEFLAFIREQRNADLT